MINGQYIQYRQRETDRKDWKEAQILEVRAHTVTLLIFPSRIVYTVDRFGIEKHIRPSPNEEKLRRTRIIPARRTEPLWKKFKDE